MGKKYSPISSDSSENKKFRPALTPEAHEQQLISLAYDLAEQQLRDGTASSQVITHFLKLGSSREKVEQERIENENQLTRAKIDNIKSQERSEELYKAAEDAMKVYNGHGSNNGGPDVPPGF